MGELWVVERLRRQGWMVEWVGPSSDYDILVEGCCRVEVKSAFVTHRKRKERWDGWAWQFSLRRNGLLVDEDLLVLLCYERLYEPPVSVFVVPGCALDAEICKIDITSRDPGRYTGRWSVFRDSWDGVELAVDIARGGGGRSAGAVVSGCGGGADSVLGG